MNEFTIEEKQSTDLLRIGPEVEKRQCEKLRKLRADRDVKKIAPALEKLRTDCRGHQNIMPALVECAHAYCTIGEIAGVMREVFGDYHDPGIF